MRRIVVLTIALGLLGLGTTNAAAAERVRITWDQAVDVDLHVYDDQGNHAYYGTPTAIPEATLSEDVAEANTPEIFTDNQEPSTRSFGYQACYFGGSGPVNVTLVQTAPDGSQTTDEFTLTTPGSSCHRAGAVELIPADVDSDGDGVLDESDNCPATPNAEQTDTNGDGIGDACDSATDTTPPEVSIDTPADGAKISDTTPTISGTAGIDAGDLPDVTVDVYQGDEVAGDPVDSASTAASDAGDWSVDMGALDDGTYTVEARQSDASGNEGSSDPVTFAVNGDVTAPRPSIGSPDPGEMVKTDSPTVSGTAATGTGDLPDVDVSVYEGDSTEGGLVDAASTSATGGTWSVGIGPLDDGVYTLQAEQSDESGNTGLSDPVTFTVDSAAPTVRITAPADHSGIDDTTPTISGTAGDAPGDATQVSVSVRSGGSVVQSLTAQRSGTSWSVDTAQLVPAQYTVVATQSDDSGNVGTSPTLTFDLFTPPPPNEDQDGDDDTPPPPVPVLGQSVVAGAVGGGTVKIKLKNGKFRTLGKNETIPLGSTIDATKGRVRLTSIGPGGKLQKADFYKGQFKVTQTGGKKKPITQLALNATLSCGKAGKASAAKKKKGKKVRRLWGDGHGSFRTRGGSAAATVRGTKWLTQDTCSSTKITVKRGVVQVRDFVKRKNVTVKKGHSYVAHKKKK